MSISNSTKLAVGVLAISTLTACSGGGLGGNGAARGASSPAEADEGSSFLDLFNRPDIGTNVKVNKYIWNASLQVLNFLPVESIDPFSGVIVTGLGRPPGGGRAYRATILISDPALEARSLNVSLQTSSGPASRATARAVEDAILARARQLRVQDGRL